MIALLSHEDEAIGLAAANALERITGAGLFEIVEEPWDAARANDPAFAGKPVPMRKVKKPTRDVEAYVAYLRGMSLYRQGNSDTANIAGARTELELAVGRDPELA